MDSEKNAASKIAALWVALGGSQVGGKAIKLRIRNVATHRQNTGRHHHRLVNLAQFAAHVRGTFHLAVEPTCAARWA